MSNYLEILAKNINFFLDHEHKRPAWLAEASGIKPPNISKILGRSGNPTLETIEALARAMDLEPSDLLRTYRVDEEFLLIIAARKRFMLTIELDNLKLDYKSSLGPMPRKKDHPAHLLRSIHLTTSQLYRLEYKILQLKQDLGIPFNVDPVIPNPERLRTPENDSLLMKPPRVLELQVKEHAVKEARKALRPEQEDQVFERARRILQILGRLNEMSDNQIIDVEDAMDQIETASAFLRQDDGKAK